MSNNETNTEYYVKSKADTKPTGHKMSLWNANETSKP
jgi:hypothetical protein